MDPVGEELPGASGRAFALFIETTDDEIILPVGSPPGTLVALLGDGDIYTSNGDVTLEAEVHLLPEPGTALLMGLGLFGWAVVLRSRTLI